MMEPKKNHPQTCKTEIAVATETILTPFRAAPHGARPLENEPHLRRYTWRHVAYRAVFVIQFLTPMSHSLSAPYIN